METRHCQAWWHEHDNPRKRLDAATRLTTGEYLELFHEPRFSIGRDDSFFCIGSCFARNIEGVLLKHGFRVTSTEIDVPQEALANTHSGPGICTKFNAYSMLNEVLVAFGEKSNPNGGLVEIGEGKYWDPQLHSTPHLSYDSARATRAGVTGCFQRLKDADVCIVTLGLTEMWWDTVLDLPLNAGPPIWKEAHRQKRFAFRNPPLGAIREKVGALCHKIHEHSGGRAKVVLTVSPVPLQRTFSDRDIIVANNYSKSLLRVVADELVQECAYVDYYPSYEYVMFSPRHLTWHEDQRHVSPRLVHYITERFIDTYVAQ